MPSAFFHGLPQDFFPPKVFSNSSTFRLVSTFAPSELFAQRFPYQAEISSPHVFLLRARPFSFPPSFLVVYFHGRPEPKVAASLLVHVPTEVQPKLYPFPPYGLLRDSSGNLLFPNPKSLLVSQSLTTREPPLLAISRLDPPYRHYRSHFRLAIPCFRKTPWGKGPLPFHFTSYVNRVSLPQSSLLLVVSSPPF